MDFVTVAACLAAIVGAVVLAPRALAAPQEEPALTLLFAVCVVLAVLNARRLLAGARRRP